MAEQYTTVTFLPAVIICKRCNGSKYVCECDPDDIENPNNPCGRCPDCHGLGKYLVPPFPSQYYKKSPTDSNGYYLEDSIELSVKHLNVQTMHYEWNQYLCDRDEL